MLHMYISLVFVAFQLSSGYDNIALRKFAQQQYPFPNSTWGADLAVDGRKSNLSAAGGQCTISNDDKQTAKWWVDLGGVLSIHHITIYYRTDNNPWDKNNIYTSRFLGFHLYISNTTNRQDGHLCVRDTTYTRSTIPPVVNTTCPVHGQYVIYYNERLSGTTYPSGYFPFAYNELCEVEVYGCTVSGFYGFDCNLPCPDSNCRSCQAETGACQTCKPGYQGHRCEQVCNPQYYGELCKLTCGNCSDGITCNTVNGTCENGCDVGVYGDKCKTPCPVGWHGKNCSLTCTNCDTCDKFTGRCTSLCHPGWKEQYCSEECPTHKYGKDCNGTCGTCKDFKSCDRVFGSCANGCENGYTGELCRKVCKAGYYGDNCTHECSLYCKTPRDCNHVTGHCIDGCQCGWRGLDCHEEEKVADSASFYGVLAALFVSVISNAVLMIYICITRRKQRQSNEKYRESNSPPTKAVELSDVNVYEKTDHTEDGYQELGPVREVSNYQELGPVREVSNYQELGGEREASNDDILR